MADTEAKNALFSTEKWKNICKCENIFVSLQKFFKRDIEMIATIQEVERFLSRFHEKVEVFDIIILNDREKNAKTQAALDISPNAQRDVIKELRVKDYSEGPIKNILNTWGDLWVFGKDVNEQEVYIKIAYGAPNRNAICVSFHLAEYPMNYPYKKKGGKK